MGWFSETVKKSLVPPAGVLELPRGDQYNGKGRFLGISRILFKKKVTAMKTKPRAIAWVVTPSVAVVRLPELDVTQIHIR